MRKSLKQKVYIIALIFLGILVILSALFYFSLRSLKLQNKEVQEQSEAELKKYLEKEEQDRLREAELADLKKQLEDLKNKPSEPTTVANPVTVEMSDPVANIVKKWSPRVAHIKCSWYSSNGSLYGTASGSATLVNFTYLGIRAITSRHIFLSNVDKSLPKDCKITLTDLSSYSILINDTNVSIGQDQDWAYVTVPQDEVLKNITGQNIKLCPSVDIGDQLIVLGYPKIGAASGLTVTEGIVSGNDEDYFITSAKIDKGNSGGAAILIKDDCYLGIPTSSAVGIIESLGKILKAKFVIQ